MEYSSEIDNENIPNTTENHYSAKRQEVTMHFYHESATYSTSIAISSTGLAALPIAFVEDI
jgi:hypothetical protein